MLTFLRRFRRNDRGLAAMEMALLAPFLMAMCFGMLEVTFVLWSTHKAEKLAVTLADVVAQSQTVTISDLTKLTDSVDRIMDPFPFEKDGIVIISSVYRAVGETTPKVNWQFKTTSTDFSATSKVGTVGADAVLPANLTLNEKDNVIVAEVFYKYKPIATDLLIGEMTIYRPAFFAPRLAALTNPPT